MNDFEYIIYWLTFPSKRKLIQCMIIQNDSYEWREKLFVEYRVVIIICDAYSFM